MKTCPKCGGQLFREYIDGKWDVVCLQCGYREYYTLELTYSRGKPRKHTRTNQGRPRNNECINERIKLHSKGLNNKAIARKMRVSPRAIYQTLERYL